MQQSTASAEAAVDGSHFGVEYQPIVELATRVPCAYEGLARFHAPDGARLQTEKVFAWLHNDPVRLTEVERELKHLQVSRAPSAPLFLNLDPDSHALARDNGSPLLDALSGHGARVIVEVVESMALSDAGRIRRMVDDVKCAGFDVALDDLGAANALVSLESLVAVDVLKFDRSVVRSVANVRYRALVESLVAVARRIGIRTVLEGIEVPEDLALADALGVDLVQGYLFRDDFITVGPPERRRLARSSGT